jgi:hypothetical protein
MGMVGTFLPILKACLTVIFGERDEKDFTDPDYRRHPWFVQPVQLRG